MKKIGWCGMLLMSLVACTSERADQTTSTQQVAMTSANALKKIPYKSAEELQRLRESGAEIIVQGADYVIVRSDSQTLSAFAANATPAQEQDLIQRLAHIALRDSSDVQKIVNSGVDLWEVKSDTALVRAFDIQLERLRHAGMAFRIVKEDASKPEGRP